MRDDTWGLWDTLRADFLRGLDECYLAWTDEPGTASGNAAAIEFRAKADDCGEVGRLMFSKGARKRYEVRRIPRARLKADAR